MKKVLLLVLAFLLLMALLAGCTGSDDTIQTCIVANESYMKQADLDAAAQPEQLSADHAAYVSVHFIESPKGMAYTVKWYLENKEIKAETKATQNDMQDVIIYELEAEKAAAGSLKVEVLYKDTVLLTKELPIK